MRALPFISHYPGKRNDERKMMDDGQSRKGKRRWVKDERRKTKRINSVRDLEVYQLAFNTAVEIFEISKGFPREEKYSLTDQIRRSWRSVCTNLAEACLRPRGVA